MTTNDKSMRGMSRRDFLESAGFTSLAVGSGALSSVSVPVAAAQGDAKATDQLTDDTYNILFILTDQESYLRPEQYPAGYSLPGRRRLQERGLTFTNHQICSAVCSSSRSVIYTGQHIQHTKVFDNLNFSWSNDLSKDIPTLGDMLRESGYYAAYKGKWHLSRAMDTHDSLALPQEELTRIIDDYGFKDYVGIGDVIGLTQGGYLNDDIIAAQAQRWLRLRGTQLNQEGKPWSLSVNLVNPHDVMFYNTDTPSQHVQDTPKPLMSIAHDPDTPLYQKQWDVPLPKSRNESFSKEGRPPAHSEYQRARAALVGNFPNEDIRWKRLLNYYFNCIRDNDRAVAVILDELDNLGLTENTIVVMTSDHGELGAGHGTHGKGATAYREQNNVPLIISHPAYSQSHGQQCQAVTSHLDLAPSMLAWSAVENPLKKQRTRELHGKDLTPLLEKGAAAGLNDHRDSALYCFNMFFYIDADMTTKAQAYLNAGGDPAKLKDQGIKADFSKRGAIRSVFDGRYRYSRYFSPKQHNQPKTLEGIFELNDVELFDLQVDPYEMNNLAIDPKQHGELLLAMNAKMNAILEAELNQLDDGSFLPGETQDWAATSFDP